MNFDLNSLEAIQQAYLFPGQLTSIHNLGSGLIHQSYLFKFQNANQSSWVVQEVNAQVFPNIKGLMKNIELTTNHLASDVAFAKNYSIPLLIKTKTNLSFITDSKQRTWRVYRYIDNAIVVEKPSIDQMAALGSAWADFHQTMSQASIDLFHDTIPQFHSLSSRLTQLKHAKVANTNLETDQTKALITLIEKNKKTHLLLEEAYKNGQIRGIIAHNDTKCTNVLFDADGKHVRAIIDLDTVMKGCIHFDFGDAIRSFLDAEVNFKKEITPEEKDSIQAFQKAYMNKHEFMNEVEKNLLPFAPSYMAFIMGVRFLTDFLNGNIYYKINYPMHNFDRARNQLQLSKLLLEIAKN